MISPVLITLFFPSFAEAAKKQTFLQPLASYPSLKESAQGEDGEDLPSIFNNKRPRGLRLPDMRDIHKHIIARPNKPDEKPDAQHFQNFNNDLVYLTLTWTGEHNDIAEVQITEAADSAHMIWLPYTPGATTSVPFSLPVLSGKFSGCWMNKYLQGGEWRVAHVGTEDGAPEQNTALKKGWGEFIGNNSPANLGGFQPGVRSCGGTREELLNLAMTSPKLDPPGTYGLVDKDFKFYVLRAQSGSAGGYLMRSVEDIFLQSNPTNPGHIPDKEEEEKKASRRCSIV